jgi:hypothetical protein
VASYWHGWMRSGQLLAGVDEKWPVTGRGMGSGQLLAGKVDTLGRKRQLVVTRIVDQINQLLAC